MPLHGTKTLNQIVYSLVLIVRPLDSSLLRPATYPWHLSCLHNNPRTPKMIHEIPEILDLVCTLYAHLFLSIYAEISRAPRKVPESKHTHPEFN